MGDTGWQQPEDRARGISAPPEILPPGALPVQDYSYQQRTAAPAPRRRSAPGWRQAPATYLLVAINVAVFLAMVASHVSPVAPSVVQLLHWGASTGQGQITETSPVIGVLVGQWWRLVTATFVHAGLVHVGLNMWCLWNLGLLGEPLLGTFGLIATYLLTGVVGNLLTVAVNPQSVGVGASGAVFGLAGVLILLLGSPLLPVPGSELKRLRKSVIYFAGINLVLGLGTNVVQSTVRIGNLAHVGGFVCGLALGIPLVPRLGADRGRWVRRQWLAYGGMLLLVLLAARFLMSFRNV